MNALRYELLELTFERASPMHLRLLCLHTWWTSALQVHWLRQSGPLQEMQTTYMNAAQEDER